MAWNQTVITDAGAALLSASIAGTELIISSAVGGTGLTDEDDMKGMTQLHEQKQILSLTRLDRLDGASRIRFQIKNADVSTAYQLQQVGIYGKLQGDSDETLLLVVQDETGIEIPAASTVEDFLVEMYVVVSITNEAEITIVSDQAALVSQAEFNVLKAEIEETYLEKNAVVNNRTTTEEGFALDARQGKALQDGLDTLNNNKLSKGGGTMTGPLRIKTNGITDGTTPAADTFGQIVEFLDSSEDARLGAAMPFASAAGRQGFFIVGYRSVGGTRVSNGLSLLVDSAGNPFVNLEQAAWLSALGLSDSGWTNASFSIDFKNFGTTNLLRYRKIGKIVQITGACSPRNDIEANAPAKTIFTLPAGYRPDQYIYARCQGSGVNTWLCSISPEGEVTISRYGAASYAAAPADTWLPMSVVFLAS